MQNELMIFESTEFGSVRTIGIEGKVYFVANDVAKALGYSNPSKATNDHCKNAIKEWGNDSLGRPTEFKVIPEGDIYRLIIKSQLPTAEKFESWIFDEIIPSIRKHGAYMTRDTLEKALTSPDFLIKLATKLKDEQERNKSLKADNERMKPKEVFADAVAASKSSILIGELAKILRQNGIDTGEKRLFHWMRQEAFLIRRKGRDYNMPTQRGMELELFEIKERTINNPDGSIRITKTVLVTGKGQQYFINKFLQKHGGQ